MPPDALKPLADVAPEGGLASLYDVVATISVTITNIGTVAASEVAQLYVSTPSNVVPLALRGFDKQLLEPGGSASFSFSLRRRDLSDWDGVRQQWLMPSGTYDLMVGKSVLDIQLRGSMDL